ncbi:type IV secretion system protein [Campylobacter sp. VTCC 70190]|uniref:type IV secretion system protein n=1 Tax=Campylobacter sp. VTCC 70190 TaxID=3392118 RepID=UPI00398F79E4
MFLNQIKRKKILISLVLSTALTQAYASGIPVLDMNALQQSIQNYQQQIKDYQEQIKQGANQVQQMAEQGIGMQIDEILGQTKDIINNTLDNLDFKLPKELFQETADVTNACSFLEQESEEFAKTL